MLHYHYHPKKAQTYTLTTIAKKFFKRKTPVSNTPIISETNINSEKHGCKCYMENLSRGEQEIADTLAQGLNYKNYFIFNNLTIPSAFNGSSQIDHLVISKFGIFVIESKDYKGWIFGSKEQAYWTQSLRGIGRNTFQFQNPLRQNWSHIQSLKLLLPSISEDTYKNIVVFTHSSQFHFDPIENVVHENDVIACIQNLESHHKTHAEDHLSQIEAVIIFQNAQATYLSHVYAWALHCL